MTENYNKEEINYSTHLHVWKLALYCIFTLNLYQFYWFYRNWEFVKHYKDKKLNPFIRAALTFAPILILVLPFILFKEIYSIIKKQSKTKNIIIAIILTLLFAGINSFMYGDGIYKWIAYLTFLPLLVVQHDINIFHKKGFYND